MKQEIESLWYQRKITGFGANGPFPTEMTVVFTVGERFVFANDKQAFVSKIIHSTEGTYIHFEDGRELVLADDVSPEILYKNIEDGDTENRNK